MWSDQSIRIAMDVALGWKEKSELCWSLWGDDKYEMDLLDLDSHPRFPNIIKERNDEFNQIVLEAVENLYGNHADDLIEAAQLEIEEEEKFVKEFGGAEALYEERFQGSGVLGEKYLDWSNE